MDDTAELFAFEIEHDPQAAITAPLPEGLCDLDALKALAPDCLRQIRSRKREPRACPWHEQEAAMKGVPGPRFRWATNEDAT